MSLDLDKLGAFDVFYSQLTGHWTKGCSYQDCLSFRALPLSTFAALVAELRAAREKIASLPAPVAVEAVAWCARRSDGTLVRSDDDELPTTTIPDHVGWTRGLDMAFPMFAPHTLVPLAPVEPTR